MSTYTPISSQTLTAAAASLTFSGIPQTYTDLVIVISAIGTLGSAELHARFNGDTGSNYSYTQLSSYGTPASFRGSNQDRLRLIPNEAISASSPSIVIAYINGYTNTTNNKTVLHRSNVASSVTTLNVSLWRNISAINTIEIFTNASTFTSGSTFTLYGIGSGSPKAFGGDEVRTDGTYWYHVYRSSGTFEPVRDISNADYLVVAGGGGAGNSQAGGAGAGGYRSSVTGELSGRNSSPESKASFLSGNKYAITLGAGGTSGSSPTNGANSSIVGSNLSIISLGGGASSTAGGSGGGVTSGAGTGAAGTANQGFDGGNAPGNPGSPGGGGGAGANGANGASGTGYNPGPAGGVGIQSSISGTATFYAGGGGAGGNVQFQSNRGGPGGNGGGGNGAAYTTTSSASTAGAANTGGGGGGGNFFSGVGQPGSAGGSGIVIVRYSV